MATKLARLIQSWKSTYSAATQYAEGDTVKFTDGHVYICKTTPPGVGYAPSNATYWEVMTQMASGLTTTGDLLTHNGTTVTRQAVGAAGTSLKMTAGALGWGTNGKFLKVSTFIDRARRSTGNIARGAAWSGTVTRLSATSHLHVHFNAPQYTDSGNGFANPYFAISSYRLHTISASGPGTTDANGVCGVIVFTPSEGLGTTVGSLNWEWGFYSYDNTSCTRGNGTNPTNSDDSRLWPDGNQQQKATSIVIYEIEP